MEFMNISFSEAASELERICDEIDNADQVDAALTEAFDAKIKSVQETIDKRITFRMYASSQIDLAQAQIDSWVKRKRKFERTLDWINADTLHVMKCYPGLPFTGALGAFRIRKSPKKLMLKENELPPHYLRPGPSFYDKDEIRKDLNDGKDVPGAKFVQEEHVRFVNQ